MDLLVLSERIQQTIILGESQFREFKSALEGPPSNKKPRDPKAVAKDIAETLVAFANADGGELLVGVEDDGKITGLSYKDDVVNTLLEAPQTRVHPDTKFDSPYVRRIRLDEKEILYFAIEKSTKLIHQTSDGKCLQRKDRENQPVSFKQLQFERHEQISREYDRLFVDAAQVSDLDLSILTARLKLSPEKCLQYLGLAEYGNGVGYLHLRRACLLLFAKDVSRWHPRCEVRIIRVPGLELKTGREYRVTSDEIARGNILQLAKDAWEKLRPHLVQTKMTIDALFQQNVMYPEDVCREALINAITHRDYSIEGQNIEIYIFDDRMEIRSPGSLLATISIDDLKRQTGRHDSRNVYTARVLRELGLVREMGEGMRRIFGLMQDADLVPPELYSESGRFTITLHHKSVFSESDQRWLDSFKFLKLTRSEMLVVLMGKSGALFSSQQIYDHLNLTSWDQYRDINNGLQVKRILRSTMPGKKAAEQASIQRKAVRLLPRYTIRPADELEKGLAEVLATLKINGRFNVFDKNMATRVTHQLLQQNPYRQPNYPEDLRALLQALNFLDQLACPTAYLVEIWKK